MPAAYPPPTSIPPKTAGNRQSCCNIYGRSILGCWRRHTFCGRRNNGLAEIVVAVPGFRTQKLVLVTTLLDAQTYSAEALGQLYFRRWAVELFFSRPQNHARPGRAALPDPGDVTQGNRDARHRLQPDPRTDARRRAPSSGVIATTLLQRHGGRAAALA